MVGRQLLPWTEAVVKQTRGESLSPLSPTPKGTQMLLSVYAADWRKLPLGGEVRRWAPHLTAGKPAA